MKLSISQITTVTQSFADDLDAYRAAGADGIGIWEMKLTDDSLEQFRASGLEAAAAVPEVPSILPLPLMEGPADPAQRVEAIRAGGGASGAVRAVVRPVPDGPGRRPRDRRRGNPLDRRGRPRARRPRRARAVQREFAHFWTSASSLGEAAALVDEAGADVGLIFDSWQLYGEPLEEIERHRDRIYGVHLADWRDPTRNTNDRVLPGDGVIDFGPILDALRWDGLYDLEIFSDPELPDSLWKEDPRELAARGIEAMRRTLSSASA